jgi:hypothetical protein
MKSTTVLAVASSLAFAEAKGHGHGHNALHAARHWWNRREAVATSWVTEWVTETVFAYVEDEMTSYTTLATAIKKPAPAEPVTTEVPAQFFEGATTKVVE